MTLIIVFLCGMLFYLFNELEDECVRNNWKGKYSHILNVIESWSRKYHKDLIEPTKKWYYFGLYVPFYEERFAFSSTFLVWLTDGEHLFQLLKIVFICIGFASIGVWNGVLCLAGILFFGFIKELFIKTIQ
jgi:hypothetical protein